MARLNEPPVAPAPADNLDAIKRRFLRQNRELAKTNSQQSIRIRALENDCSHLVAENLSLRERVLQMQNTLQAQAQAPTFLALDAVKTQLEIKIQELGGLVAQVGQLNKRERSQPCQTQATATKKSPEERQWRSALCLQEVENALLPTIVEDKFYPRMTIDPKELHDVLDDPDSQSPDIGPPPVSRFENEEPITFNPSPSEAQSGETTGEEEAALPINLETRRRRRESGPKGTIRRVSLFESPPDEQDSASVNAVRTGAKRKFSVQQDDEKTQAELFRFSRRNMSASVDNKNSIEESRPQSPKRPVLGSKPVNTDPVLSPKKQRSATLGKPEKPEKQPTSRTSRTRLTITRNAQTEIPLLEMPAPLPAAEIHLDSLPPKTPAAEDIFSPLSTEPSTARPDSKDTPPPGDLNSVSQTGIGGRPSRRVRAQVSYKEPSLNTKMRRPGKELVDAVQSDSCRRTSIDPQPPSSAPDTDAAKQESDSSTWKPIGVPGLRTGEDEAEMGSPLRQKQDRNEVTLDGKPDPLKWSSAATARQISAMIEETRRKSLGLPVKPTSEELKLEPMADEKLQTQSSEFDNEMAIFDFNESSSPVVAPPSSRPLVELAKVARAARRHSSIPASTATDGKRSDISTKSEGTHSAPHKRASNNGIKSITTTTSSKSIAAARTSSKERQSRASALAPSGSNSDFKARNGSEEQGVDSVRSDRAASRRRSMMV